MEKFTGGSGREGGRAGRKPLSRAVGDGVVLDGRAGGNGGGGVNQRDAGSPMGGDATGKGRAGIEERRRCCWLNAPSRNIEPTARCHLLHSVGRIAFSGWGHGWGAPCGIGAPRGSSGMEHRG
eukprot:Gb_14126 [translate_table: standard]